MNLLVYRSQNVWTFDQIYAKIYKQTIKEIIICICNCILLYNQIFVEKNKNKAATIKKSVIYNI